MNQPRKGIGEPPGTHRACSSAVEQVPLKHSVRGSNPLRLTNQEEMNCSQSLEVTSAEPCQVVAGISLNRSWLMTPLPSAVVV